MFEIRRASHSDSQTAFDIRLLAIRHQCIGAYTQAQLLAWTAGAAEDGYDTLMEKHFYLGCIEVPAIYRSPSGLQLACVPMVKGLS